MTVDRQPLWRFRNHGVPAGLHEAIGVLLAHWEVEGDPISGHHLPDEIDAHELFDLWATQAQKDHPDGLIPIYWSVDGSDTATHEAMPFQHSSDADSEDAEDFLTFYTWPENATTGERLNWLSLPVKNKLWRADRTDPGGFIQEATGWKPSILQPFVYLPSLLKARG